MADAGIQLHTNCTMSDWNDGEELDRLFPTCELRHSIRSLAVVPVGLTGHRDRLTDIRPFTRELAAEVIRQVDKWQSIFRTKWDTGFVYAADEFYTKAGVEFPGSYYYDDFPQVENGVGLTVQFQTEFEEMAEELSWRRDGNRCKPVQQTAVTGKSILHPVDMVNRANSSHPISGTGGGTLLRPA